MKKIVYILPCVLAILVLGFTVLMIVQTLVVENPLPFVGYGGRYAVQRASILGISHSWFMMLLGALITVLLAVVRRKQYGVRFALLLAIAIILPVQAVLGSKLLYGIERVIGQGDFNMSGLSLFGGVYLTLLFVPLVARIFKIKAAQLFDFVAPLGMVLIASSRFGCFFAHCCAGGLQMINGKPFYLPVPLIEIFFDLAILAVLLYLEQSKLSWGQADEKASKLNPYHGILALLILLSYGVIRFTLEFFRERTAVFAGMSFGHIHSLICIAIGVWALLRRREQYQRALEKSQRHSKQNSRRR